MCLLNVHDLSVSFVTRNGTTEAVKKVNFSVEAKSITAIIGESGSGKSVSCYALLGLIPQPPGRIDSGTAEFNGQDLLVLSERELRGIRGSDIAMIFQDPMTCLNPYMRIGEQLIEPLLVHGVADKETATRRATELLDEVGIHNPEAAMRAYPFEFSGGMRQRVMIAMALITEPKLLIADEPTTALDVTIQAQILRLIKSLQEKRDIGVLFISHDLAVVSDIADDIVVMEKGLVVEQGAPGDIFTNARHPYTQKLLAAIPSGAPPEPDTGRDTLITATNLKTYFTSHAFQVMDTDTFLDYLNDNLLNTEELRSAVNVPAWVDGQGLPGNCPEVKSARIERVDATLNAWTLGNIASDALPWSDWLYQERYRFLSNLPDNTDAARLAELDAAWDINSTGNNEVLFAWLEQAVRSQHTKAYDRLRTFLVGVGRRKFLTPIYKAMVETGQTELARDIYKEARPNYHSVATGTMDELLGVVE